jgi:ribokinase
MQANVVIIGSLNMDLVTRAPRLPRGGETLAGTSFATLPGGKGANQAVAAARLGASVAMVGCVGDDAYGEQLRAALLGDGVDCTGVAVDASVSTGIAMIVVDDSSQNAIVIVAGANGQVSAESVAKIDALLSQASVIVCQLEIPLATVGHVLKRGRELGKIVILNPAPANAPLPADWYGAIDYLIPNESEASVLSGRPVDSVGSADAAASALLAQGARNVIITLGSQGALYSTRGHSQHFAAKPVQAVDTTAAGDTFVGGFAAALAQGKSAAEAIVFGQAAAALSVTREGAQPSIPTLAEVLGSQP